MYIECLVSLSGLDVMKILKETQWSHFSLYQNLIQENQYFLPVNFVPVFFYL